MPAASFFSCGPNSLARCKWTFVAGIIKNVIGHRISDNSKPFVSRASSALPPLIAQAIAT
jgi:hypothetical protein